MSFTDVVSFEKLPWGGRTAPGEPSGIWTGHGEPIGDASLGTLAIQINFHEAATPLSAILYQLSDLSIRKSPATVDENCIIESGMAWPGHRPWLMGGNVQMIFVAVTNASFASARDLAGLRGMVFGSATNVSTAFSLRCVGVNILGERLTFTCRGYYWDQQAIGAPGGPRLPLQGLFRS